MKKSVKIIGSSLLVGTLLFGPQSALAGNQSNPSQQAFDNKIVKRIDINQMYQNVFHFAENIGPRVAGSAEELQTVNYIADQFKQYKLDDVQIQPFEYLSGYKSPTTTSFTVEGQDQSFDVTAFGYSPNTEVDGLQGELVYVGLGGEEDVENVDLDGKIAVIDRGAIPFATKENNAKDAGANGVVIVNNVAGLPNYNLSASETNLPTLFMTKEDGDRLITSVQSNDVSGTIKISGAEFIKDTSHNVIATKNPKKNKDTNQIIIVGAHHDSVSVGTGASDNASGVSVLLELARVMRNAPTDTEIRFVTFGAEERGLIGSYHYANNLSQDEIDRTVGMFNMDMVGSQNSGDFAMFTADGNPNTVTTLGNSAGIRLHDAIAYNQVGRSDHQPFTEVGIPAAVFSYAPLEPEYHSPGDQIELISKDKLLKTAEVLGAAIYRAARPDTPALERSNVAPAMIDSEHDEDLHL